MQNEDDKLITAVFRSTAVQDEVEGRKQGRPIFKDVELVDIRIPADRLYTPTFGAHDFWKNIDGIPYTYAMRFPEQYRRFKEGKVQVAEGTPLEELPFLTNAKRSELKALSIYTAEQLASLDGKNLKTLGMGGREMKDQAAAYLERASGSADVTELARKNAALEGAVERLQQEIRDLRRAPVVSDKQEVPEAQSDFQTWSDEELKLYIKDASGQAPRGNPSHETLVRMADDLLSKEAA